MVDLNNYKGIYFDDDNEKYQCPETGAHFKFEDLCARMERIRIKRGDPKIEFDAQGNKVHVKSVALAGNKSNTGSMHKDGSQSRTLQTANKTTEKRKLNQDSKPKTTNKKGNSQAHLNLKTEPDNLLNEAKNDSETVKITGSILAAQQ